MNLRRPAGRWWHVLILIFALVVLTAVVATAPLQAALVVLTISAVPILIWKFGSIQGIWLLLIATVPLREPLSFDVLGTMSLYVTDLGLVVFSAALILKRGVRDAWNGNTSLKVGILILIVSIAGLYSATRISWGIAATYRIAVQLQILFLACHLIRSGREARNAIIAILVGLIPAILYGLFQASLPYEAELPDWANRLTAHSSTGEPNIRVFSTFSHPLRFSHSLSIGFGIALSLALSPLSRGWKFFAVVVAALALYCNMFTYSIGGVLGMLSGAVAVALLNRGKRLLLFSPVILILLIVLSPPALKNKAERVFTGQATTGAARLITYKQAIDVLRDRPLFGIGWGSIRESLEGKYRISRATAIAFGAENYFLQRGVALGLFGIVAYVYLCARFFRTMFKSRHFLEMNSWPVSTVITAAVVFYTQAQFYPAASPVNNYILWLLLGIGESARNRVRLDEELEPVAALPRRTSP